MNKHYSGRQHQGKMFGLVKRRQCSCCLSCFESSLPHCVCFFHSGVMTRAEKKKNVPLAAYLYEWTEQKTQICGKIFNILTEVAQCLLLEMFWHRQVKCLHWDQRIQRIKVFNTFRCQLSSSFYLKNVFEAIFQLLIKIQMCPDGALIVMPVHRKLPADLWFCSHQKPQTVPAWVRPRCD